MKIDLSLPAALRAEADAAAKDLGVSRSRLVQIALEEFLKQQREEAVTNALNRSLEKHPDAIDPIVQHFALESLKRMEWEE